MNTHDALQLGWTVRAGQATHKAGHVLERIDGVWVFVKMAIRKGELIATKPKRLRASTVADAIQAVRAEVSNAVG